MPLTVGGFRGWGGGGGGGGGGVAGHSIMLALKHCAYIQTTHHLT